MTPAEARVRAAVEALTDALLDALRAEAAAQARGGPDQLLSIREAAETLGIGRSRLYDEIGAGRLRSVKVGRRRLVPAAAIRAYIEGGHARS